MRITITKQAIHVITEFLFPLKNKLSESGKEITIHTAADEIVTSHIRKGSGTYTASPRQTPHVIGTLSTRDGTPPDLPSPQCIYKDWDTGRAHRPDDLKLEQDLSSIHRDLV